MFGRIRYFKPEYGFGVIYCPELKASFKFKAHYSPNLPTTLRRNQRVQFETFTQGPQTFAQNVTADQDLGPDGRPCSHLSLYLLPRDQAPTAALYTALLHATKEDLPYAIYQKTSSRLILILADDVLTANALDYLLTSPALHSSLPNPNSFLYLDHTYYKVIEATELQQKESEDLINYA